MFVSTVEYVCGATTSWLPMTGSDCADLWCTLSVSNALFSFLCRSHLKKSIKRKGLRRMPRKRVMSQGMTLTCSLRSIQKTSSREQKFWQVRQHLPRSITRNTTENRGDPYQIMQTQHLCFLGGFLNTFIAGSQWLS